jgi:23S rRNA pseudouridine1911/1915/1917 synthase
MRRAMDEAEPEIDDEPERYQLVVDEAHAGERVDAVVAVLIAGLSRAAVQRLIGDGDVAIGGKRVTKANQRLRAGDTIDVVVPPPVAVELLPEAIPLVVVYEDADLIAIDKPAGLVVHPAAGHPSGTLVNALLHHCKDLGGIGGELRPGIVHRLDRDTTGVMVAAKSERAHAALVAAFADKTTILREYLAIAAPPPPAASGTLQTLYNRHPVDRKRFSSKVATGRPAITHWTIEERLRDDAAALVRLRLATGRTHQIRVHAADHGWPLLGDVMYGRAPKPLAPLAKQLGRQALHAAVLAFAHPVTGAPLRFESPLPPDLVAVLEALR